MSTPGFQPDPPDVLPCVGLTGTTAFFVDYSSPGLSGLSEWHFRVHRTLQPNETDYWFDLVLEPFEGKLRSATIHANGKTWYHKQGIPEAALRYARRITGTPIVSSSNKDDEKDEWQTPEATKVWERIPEAEYDPVTERYTLS